MKIVTDHKWKLLKDRTDVPSIAKDMDFDWIDFNLEEYWTGFFEYKGAWYHISEFMNVDILLPFYPEWNGYKAETAWSDVVIRISDDGEEYKIGTYFS